MTFEALFGVEWFDGLLVKADHLLHADERVGHYFALLGKEAVDQPGMLTGGWPGNLASQIVSLDIVDQTGSKYRVSGSVVRRFLSITPSGSLVVGLSRDESSFGSVTNRFELEIDAGMGEALICVTQRPSKAPNVALDEVNEQITLRAPSLIFRAVPPTEYELHCYDTLGQYSPVCLLTVTESDCNLEETYIPPVVRLSSIGQFNDTLLPRIQESWNRLRLVTSGNIEAAGASFARGNAGSDLISRRSDYEALRTIQLTTVGMVKNLPRFSPYMVLFNVVHPLALWWLDHKNRHFKDAESRETAAGLVAISQRAERLLEMDVAKLSLGTSGFLRTTDELLTGICTTLDSAG